MDGCNVKVGDASAFDDQREDGNWFAVFGVMGLLVQDKTRRMRGRSGWCGRHGTVLKVFTFAVDQDGCGDSTKGQVARSRDNAIRSTALNTTSILPSMGGMQYSQSLTSKCFTRGSPPKIASPTPSLNAVTVSDARRNPV